MTLQPVMKYTPESGENPCFPAFFCIFMKNPYQSLLGEPNRSDIQGSVRFSAGVIRNDSSTS